MKHLCTYLCAGILIAVAIVTPEALCAAKARLDKATVRKIGERVWKNEAGGNDEHLVFWSPHESFPSLGIGHNLWFTEGQSPYHTECFPELCAYLKKRGVTLPRWLEAALPRGAPWKNRDEFYSDTKRTAELRKLLTTTTDLQTQFMVDRFVRKLPELVRAVPWMQRSKVQHIVDCMLASPTGTYALIDYFNFKGDGLNPQEESQGRRWGLLSVLIDMPSGLTCDNVTKAFALTAASKLLMLIEHSAPDYRRIRWLNGWMKRVSTYADSSL